ncbi:MAG: hypothetical protein OXH79_06255 [Boseongicola sp.]|nr:hypothetical protein [Boseongicola sp.]
MIAALKSPECQRWNLALGVPSSTRALTFMLTQIPPCDAAEIRLGQNATPELFQALREELGLGWSLLVQDVSWLGNLLTGNLGIFDAGGATIAQLPPKQSLELSWPGWVAASVAGIWVLLALIGP